MKELLFKNPILNDGLNVTVRNGTKWITAQPGEEVTVKETDSDHDLGKGIILSTQTYHFNDIPPALLQFEHDPECVTPYGLRKAMDSAYGQNKWGPEVTVILFWYKSGRDIILDAIDDALITT